uniref:Uncharacterized protein n=1 Tax=Panagrolaimus superbus TaxID=310955 RepID=A0A914XXC9_9BILA
MLIFIDNCYRYPFFETAFCCLIIVSADHHQKMAKKVYDKNSDAFYCCCGCMRVTTGTAVICILQLLFMVINSVLTCLAVDFKLETVGIVCLVLVSLVSLAVYATPFIGLCIKSPGCLWPYIIFSIFNLVLSFGFLITSFVGLCLDEDKMNLIIGINLLSFKRPEKHIGKPGNF